MRGLIRSAARRLAALALALAPAAALGQVTNGTQSQSTSGSIAFSPETVTTTRTQAFSTQVLGRLAGAAPVFDSTFAAAFADPAVQAGVEAARLAVTAAGGPGVTVTGPTLTDSRTTTTSTSVTRFSVGALTDPIPLSALQQPVSGELEQFFAARGIAPVIAGNTITYPGIVQELQFAIVVGPGVELTGDRGDCASAVATLPSADRPVCAPGNPTTLNVPFGVTNGNANLDSAYTVDQATTVTETVTLFEQYTVLGTMAVVRPLGTAHTAVEGGMADGVGRMLRRMGDEAGGLGIGAGARGPNLAPAFPGATPQAQGRFRPWLEVYAAGARVEDDGAVAGEDRDATGVGAGAAVAVMPGLSVGAALDVGRTDIRYARPESADLDLTQVGLFAVAERGPWVASLTGAVGWGEAKVRDDDPTLTAPSRADYDVTTYGLFAEVGYSMGLDGWRLTPSAGLDWRRIEADGFTESGGAAALTGASRDLDRTQAWLGLSAARLFDAGAPLGFSLYARGVGVLSGRDRDVDAAFVADPATRMTIRGVEEGSFGADFGASLTLGVAGAAEIFVGYDGALRDGFDAHAATIGARLRW